MTVNLQALYHDDNHCRDVNRSFAWGGYWGCRAILADTHHGLPNYFQQENWVFRFEGQKTPFLLNSLIYCEHQFEFLLIDKVNGPYRAEHQTSFLRLEMKHNMRVIRHGPWMMKKRSVVLTYCCLKSSLSHRIHLLHWEYGCPGMTPFLSLRP